MTERNPLQPLPADRWDASLSPVLADMKGRPLNVHKLMANHPRLLAAWWSYRNYSVSGGDLGQRSGELAILRVAVHMAAWYEWASHVDRGLKAGLSREEIERVRRGPGDPAWPCADAALLRAVDECMDQRRIGPDALRALHDHYSDNQILDLIAILGMYVTLGLMINSWGLDLDEHVALPADVDRDEWERSPQR